MLEGKGIEKGQRATRRSKLSPRLRRIVDALPLRSGMAVLEIGCGPGAMARELARRVGYGRVVAIDRSEKAIARARAGSVEFTRSGRLRFVCMAVEDFVLDPADEKFDLAIAVRVGVLDGRYPEQEERALRRVAEALIPGGDPLIEKPLGR